ncbi:peroxiredoxin-like family protein [Azospirillum sp. B510]|uniref:peroxiredoxin-like family protein n=1 Tax=Azospirillum sp. (strain B510) TaxID=137722 RepID=UPI0002D389E3|nr:peroxiredoxin-like family protein [Azospirillum sp. B510]
MRLQRQLRNIRAQAGKTMPPAVLATMDRVIADLKARGVELGALRPGLQAPDFALPNQLGRTVSLYETLEAGPVVLLFYRGEWCPYCCAQLRSMQLALPQLTAGGARLVAVSPELPDHSLTLAERNALDFDILSDQGATVARSYGLIYRVPDELCDVYRGCGLDLNARQGRPPGEPWHLPIPATYLLSPSGVVRFAAIDADFTQRPEPQALVDLLHDRVPAA